MVLFYSLLAALSLDLLAVVILTAMANQLEAQAAQEQLARKEKRRSTARRKMDKVSVTEQTVPVSAAASGLRNSAVCTVGVVYNQGARPSQQDNKCVESVYDGKGILAVVADGMGGLSGGDKVSGRIVQDIHALAPKIKPETQDSVLPKIVEHISNDVNNMLGPNGIYKSGSTFLSVLTNGKSFSWATVGDSHIYLFRGGVMSKVNLEHNQLTTEWMPEVQAGRMDIQTAMSNPDGKKLTSFIGMGSLRYVSFSRSSIPLMPGDRILLMSDGVFNTLSDQQMAEILLKCPDVVQAASLMENQVLAARAPGQDNFTAVILGF